MINRYVRLRVRRKIRSQKKTINKVGEQAGEQFETNVLDRWRNLQSVQRFALGWLLLIGLLVFGVFMQNRQLGDYYRTDLPVAGGTFREGVVGEITNMNPIFATRAADRAATKLQFSTLFSYDQDGDVVGDLAESYSVSDDRTIYTVKLREDVRWHDGQIFDADDVVFTYELIQHPDTRSFLNVAWRDIKVQSKDQFTATFTLPNPFTPFIFSLTEGGIIPEHILGELNPAQLRGDEFNTSAPVGTGPFKFDDLLGGASDTTIDERELRLDKYSDYHRGEPKLEHFILSTHRDREQMVQRFIDGDLAAIGGLTTADRDIVLADPEAIWHDLPLNNIVFVFFKTSEGPLKTKEVRQALTHAIDPVEVQKVVDSRFRVLDSPILPNHTGYDKEATQKPFDLEKANKLLEDAGWKYKEGDANDGFRYKDDARLEFTFFTQNSDDYPEVSKLIDQQWRAVGADVNATAVEESEIQQNHISPHNYGALLFGVAMGPDPDSFVYWHSSQSGVNGFNLSEVENLEIDEALESGRTRLDTELRVAKYRAFLDTWQDISPAVALYQPGYSYAQRRSVDGFEKSDINTPEQRYESVYNWQINTIPGPKPF